MKNEELYKIKSSKQIKMFSFIDFELLKTYELLGFNCEIDDEVNEIYYCELITDDILSVQNIIDECERFNIDVHFEVDNKIIEEENIIDYLEQFKIN